MNDVESKNLLHYQYTRSSWNDNKAALSGFTKSLSCEVGKANITVNTIAQAVVYLLSDSAKSITGSTITIDAGSTA